MNNEIKQKFKIFLAEAKKALAEFSATMKAFLSSPPVKRTLDDLKVWFSRVLKAVVEIFLEFISHLKHQRFEWLRWSAAISLTIGLMFFLLGIAVFFEVGDRWDSEEYTITIPRGYGASKVADLLIDNKILKNRYGFNLILNFLKISDRIQAGTYSFSPSMSLARIVWKIKDGKVVSVPQVRLVFPEGVSIYNIGEIMKNRNIGDGPKFRENLNPPDLEDLKGKYFFLKDLPIDSLEGYLFPDTYLVLPDVSNFFLRDLMLSRFASVVLPFWNNAKQDTQYSLHEILTLASIIEKEAAVHEERTVISSVFHNRLNRGIKLAADPTVKYALSEIRRPTKRVYYIDLEVDSPYNTYMYAGLPPGPICSPGLASIKAAVYPEKTNYYYFVARPDGTHIFSTNWRDHEKAKELVRQGR